MSFLHTFALFCGVSIIAIGAQMSKDPEKHACALISCESMGKEGPPGKNGLSGAKGEKGEQVLSLEEQFHQVEGKVFATNGEQVDFEASKMTCEKAGGRIATPKNEAENNAVLNILKKHNEYAYLGVTEGVIPSAYLYLDGTPLSYFNWRKNEPNGRGKEKCVEMYTDGQWNDKACNQNRLVVCEF
ncbi:hypothetical protein XELAEV_18000633mg [Xenopus laevis]|nr:hypothetical protein XELAEV_18000633mg [Xenopus laevis]